MRQQIVRGVGARRRRRALFEPLESRCLLSAGNLDPTFGAGGFARTELWPNAAVQAAALASNGDIVVAGLSSPITNSFSSTDSGVLSLFHADGTIDRSFGSGGVTSVPLDFSNFRGDIIAAAVQADQKILVLTNDSVGTHLLRYLPSGALDSSFGSKGTVAIASVALPTAMKLESNGAILIAGDHTNSNGDTNGFSFARLTSGGAPDHTFGAGGSVFIATNGRTESVNLALASNGNIIAAGNIGAQIMLARFHANGTLDSTFGTGGKVFAPADFALQDATSIALQSDDKIVLGGTLAEYDLGAAAVARFTSSGAVDTSFGKKGVADINPDNAPPFQYGVLYNEFDGPVFVTVQKDGAIIAAGTYTSRIDYEYSPGGFYNSWFALARLNPDGHLDTAARGGGLVKTPLINDPSIVSTLLQPDGKIIAVGDSALYDHSQDILLARYNADATLDDSFGFHGAVQEINGISGIIKSVALQSGKIIVAGSEAAPDPSKPQAAVLARYNSDGTLDTTFGDDGRVFVQLGRNAAYNSLIVEPNGYIVAGGYGTIGVESVFALSRFGPNGKPDPHFGHGGTVLTSFGDGTGQAIVSIAQQPNGQIVAAGSTTGGIHALNPKIAVARYWPDGAIDWQFADHGKFMFANPLARGVSACGVALQSDGKIVIGGTINVGTDNINEVATEFAVLRLSSNGRLDPTFGTAGIVFTAIASHYLPSTATAHALGIDSNGRIVLAGFAGPSGFGAQMAVVRYLSNGALDRTFCNGGIFSEQLQSDFDDEINCLVIRSDNKILVGGVTEDQAQNQLARPAIIRPKLTGNPPYASTVALINDHGLAPSFAGGYAVAAAQEDPVQSLLLQPDGKIVASAGQELFRMLGS